MKKFATQSSRGPLGEFRISSKRPRKLTKNLARHGRLLSIFRGYGSSKLEKSRIARPNDAASIQVLLRYSPHLCDRNTYTTIANDRRSIARKTANRVSLTTLVAPSVHRKSAEIAWSNSSKVTMNLLRSILDPSEFKDTDSSPN